MALAAAAAALALLGACTGGRSPDEAQAGEHADPHAGTASAQDEIATGIQGGRLLRDGELSVELLIDERSGTPYLRAWARRGDHTLPPCTADDPDGATHCWALQARLDRLGGRQDALHFVAQDDSLRSIEAVSEPHSFDVALDARLGGEARSWRYASYEGRTRIAAATADEAGIAVAAAGSGSIRETLHLYGSIAPDATRLRAVGARFTGVVRSVGPRVGDTVKAGATLATVESNESLKTYAVTAPMAGVVTRRDAEIGEQTGTEPMFELADFSQVWAEFNVFPNDRPRLKIGLPLAVTAEGASGESRIDYISPLGTRSAQTVLARATLDNRDARWTPGQFVEAQVVIAEAPVPLVVPLDALQRFRDFDVVYARYGEDYEVRMLTLGRRDAESVEVLAGLEPGTPIVVRNSYLVKADIEKSGASHDH